MAARTRASALALGLALGLGACASEDVKSVDRGAVDDSSTTSDADPPAAIGEDGARTYTGRLPPNFPAEVPVPQDGRIVNATTNGTTFSATFERSNATPEAALAGYRTQLEAAQFLVPDSGATPFASVSAVGHGWSVTLIATPADTDVVLSLSIAPA